ncbi:MAG: ABC1 kinase family protein [Dehalococcoidia bacterium]|mgnify:CR=1 FL=1|nr:ABC1 kinase family protein [Dehalococcoidia bacterium]
MANTTAALESKENQSPFKDIDTSRPPYGKLRRLIPLAYTLLTVWLKWRVLRIRRKFQGDEKLSAATHEFHQNAALSVVRLAVKQQGMIVKMCQFLGARADVLMEEYVRTLSLVHDSVPPRPWSEVKDRIETELGAPVEDLFDYISPEPVAAASLAQVHRARTKDGDDVAVKVQHVGIDRIVEWDLQAVDLLSTIWSRLETIIDFRPMVEEMRRNAPEEVDFIHEGHAAEEVAQLLAGRNDVLVPKIYWELSSIRVLTMEYIDGIKITDIETLREAGINPPDVADVLIDLYNNMILKHGMFHADPHPGNLFVLPPLEGDESPRIGLVDFGLTKSIPIEFREQLIVLTSAIIEQQSDAISTTMNDMGFRTREDNPETYNALGEAFLGDVLRSGRAYADQDMVAEINESLGRVLRANPIIDLPGDVILIARVMGLLSGLGRTLESETDLMASVLPFLDPDKEQASDDDLFA